MKKKITRKELDDVLNAWSVARTTVAYEHESWNLVLKSKKLFIESARKLGYTNSAATLEYNAIVKAHSEAYSKAWKNMMDRGTEYKKLLDKYRKQKG